MFILRNIFHPREQASNPHDIPDGVETTTLQSRRLAVFDTTQSSGVSKSQLQRNMYHVTDTATQLLRSFGKRGKGKGQLYRPGGVAITSEGDIVVVDTENCRLQVFNSMGQHVLCIGEKGQGQHQLNQPMDVCILRHLDKECFLVSDSVNACVKVFSRSGSHVQSFGDKSNLFEYPYGVCTCGDHNIVVTDICRHDITVLTCSGEKRARFGQYGDGPCDLDHPYFVVSDPDENIFVSDSGNMSVKIFTTDGALLYHFRSSDFHIYDEDFVMLQSLAIDGEGNILVVANTNVYVMANNGRFWEALLPCSELLAPKSVGFSPLGHLIVVQDFADLECVVYIFRYPIENFRSLKAVSRPRPLTKITRSAQRRSLTCQRTSTAITQPAAPSTGKGTQSVSKTSKGCERKDVAAQRKVKSGHRTIRRTATSRENHFGQMYFLGPKSGRAVHYQREGRSASCSGRSPPIDYDLDRELEIDLDLVHRLREKRCLNGSSNKKLSPAHIFGFS